jgi:hypothetical protein
VPVAVALPRLVPNADSRLILLIRQAPALRTLIRYRGDLSTMALEALAPWI